MTLPFAGGVYPVVSMPFLESEDVDDAALVAEVEWLIDCGAQGVVLAMVSEVLRLTDPERRHVAQLLCDRAEGRIGVVIAVGSETTRAAVSLAVHAEAAGASAVMAVPPISVALPEDQLFGYYAAVIDAVQVPVVVQDASGYVGRPLSLDLYRGLLDRFGPMRVQFKPEAQPIGARLSALREASGGRARVFEGTGGLALVDSHRRGIVGTMPGAEVPWAIVALWRALEDGDTAHANAIHGPLAALVSLQTTLDSFIAVEKHLLVRQGVLPSARRRSPHGGDLDPETLTEVERLADLLASVVRGS